MTRKVLWPFFVGSVGVVIFLALAMLAHVVVAFALSGLFAAIAGFNASVSR